jgi:cytochrome b pre-mRNA-processing protein 3
MPAPAAIAQPAISMFSLPFRRQPRNPTIEGLYGMIVAQARSRVFYADFGVPDTVSGRIDMIMLHLVLVLRRLRQGQANVPVLGQQIFDWFCRDMDHNFREMGVGDLAVPKEMRRVAEAFYGRAGAYEAGLASADPALLDSAVARNVFGMDAVSPSAIRLAAYMREAAERLSAQEPANGSVRFPDPAASPGSKEGMSHDRA